MPKNKGYIPSVIESEHWILGASLPDIELEPQGNWTSYTPKFEPQRKQIETYNCTGFNTLNTIEMVMQRLGIQENYSDRWVGIIAGTKFPGNDPHTVAEAIRKNGLIPESMLPFSDDLKDDEEYYSFKGANEEECRKAGQDWLAKWDFKHYWVDPTPQSMMTALKYSPLGVAVFAWIQENGLYIKPEGTQENHWTVCVVGYEVAKYWLVDDSYLDGQGSELKKLDWNYKFGAVKVYSITPKPPMVNEVKKNLIQMAIGLIKQLIELLMKKQAENRTPPETSQNPPEKTSETPPKPTTLPPKPQYPSEWLNFGTEDDKLIQALIMKESQNDDSRIGDLQEIDKAYGCLQIRKGYITDVNSFYDTNFKSQDCLNNRELSVYVVKAYWTIWATKERIGRIPTWEDKARIHNAGPRGWKNEVDYVVLTEKDKKRVFLAKLYWSDVVKYFLETSSKVKLN